MPPSPRVLFLCGSPRRNKSVSTLTARYLAKFLDHDHAFLDLARAKLSSDPGCADPGFERVVEAMQAADAVIWTFGAWSWFVPTALHRLFDKLFTQGPPSLAGKLSAAVLCSGGVGDDFALERVRFVSEQLGFAHLGEVSAIASPFMGYIDDQALTEHACRVLAGRIDRALDEDYRPARVHPAVDPRLLSSAHPGPGFDLDPAPPVEPTGEGTIVAVASKRLDDDPAARDVVASLRRFSANPVEVVELEALKLRPCAGCYLCGTRLEGVCVLKDDYADLRERLDRAAGLVYLANGATGLIDPVFKTFLDRSWDLAHRPRWHAKHGLVVVTGGGALDVEGVRILDNILSKTGTRVVAALAQSESPPSAFAATVRHAVQDLDRAMDEGWRHPDRFRVRASGWAFRDLAAAYGMVMKADYAYHRDRGLFDAPSPGGTNTLMRLAFSNEGLAKSMLTKARAQHDKARADRLQRHLEEGGRLGEGNEVEALPEPVS